jgi:hypothetical protein
METNLTTDIESFVAARQRGPGLEGSYADSQTSTNDCCNIAISQVTGWAYRVAVTCAIAWLQQLFFFTGPGVLIFPQTPCLPRHLLSRQAHQAVSKIS